MMRDVLQRLRRAVDTRSLRERCVFFVAALLALALIGKIFLFDPQFARQQKLHDQIRADTAKTAVAHAEITRQMQSRVGAADAVKQAMLASLQGQSQGLRSELSDINRMLVKPDDMAALLGDILMRHNRLRLVSFTTLPATNLLAGLTSAASMPAIPGDIYKHSVELVVQGNYLDMLTYMVALEAIPSRLFWAKAVMHVDAYPEATLTLSLFTLSLDKKWLSL